MENIETGFAEVIKKLEEKRDQLKNDFTQKYENEAAKFSFKVEILDQNSVEITNIESIYEELAKFVDRNADAKILTRINDISDFMSKSIEDLERITKMKGFEKQEQQIDPQLTPLSLNVQKVFNIVSKFNMVAPAQAHQNL